MFLFTELIDGKNVFGFLNETPNQQDLSPLHKSLKSKSEEFLYKRKNKWVIDAKRVVQQHVAKTGTTPKQIKLLFKKVVDWLIKKGKTSREYLFYSKSLNQGIVISYRPHEESNSKSDQIMISAILPVGKSPVKQDAENVSLETYSDTLVSQEFVNYVDEIRQPNLHENIVTEGRTKLPVKGLSDLEFYFVSGKVWDVVGYDLIELT